ncbi:MAG: hypothetical protein WBN24_05345 [Acidimicrobiia bacterium]
MPQGEPPATLAESYAESAQITTTTIGSSVIDDLPGVDRYGSWWLVPESTLVVRGVLKGTSRTLDDGRAIKDIWVVEEPTIVLGDYVGDRIEVAADSKDDPLWHEGLEAIFFLVPLRLSRDTASPELWVPRLGSNGVVTSELDKWQAALPAAEEGLGNRWLADHSSLDDTAIALYSELVVSGTVEAIGDVVDVLGAKYVAAELKNVALDWMPMTVDGEEQGDATQPSESMTVQMTEAQSKLVSPGSAATFFLAWTDFKGQLDASFLPIGGLRGVETDRAATSLRIDEMDSLRSTRDARITAGRSETERVLEAALTAHGRIPIGPHPDESAIVAPSSNRELYHTPLLIVQDGMTVEFDRWFFSLLDGQATVTVTDDSGQVILSGLVEGPASVVRETESGDLQLLDSDDTVVATVTQEELAAAISGAQ